jgi:hypothetical protein
MPTLETDHNSCGVQRAYSSHAPASVTLMPFSHAYPTALLLCSTKVSTSCLHPKLARRSTWLRSCCCIDPATISTRQFGQLSFCINDSDAGTNGRVWIIDMKHTICLCAARCIQHCCSGLGAGKQRVTLLDTYNTDDFESFPSASWCSCFMDASCPSLPTPFTNLVAV